MNSTVAVAIGASSVAIGAAVLCMVSRRFRGEASKLLAEEQRVIVSVKTGSLAGRRLPTRSPGKPVHRFLAIPYAAAPVGAQRWRPPLPPTTWTGVRQEPKLLPVCPQPSRGPFGSLGTFEGHTTAQSEDCLHLNVWSPRLDPAAMLPVVVYIHGGAGKHGAGMLPHFDGLELAAEDVCYVAINYRLGVLGFLAHPALTAEPENNGSSGNFAILDQIAALAWVKQNIAAFGGNLANVTIWGLSSGSQYVATLCSSPAAEGLFHRAFVQSCTDVGNVRKLKTGSVIWQGKSAEDYGCEYGTDELGADAPRGSAAQLAQMRAAPLATIVSSWDADGATDMYETCVDGGAVKPCSSAEALVSGRFHCKSLLIGYTADDGLGSVELEAHMFEEDDLDVAGYHRLLAREFGPDAKAVEGLFSAVEADADVDNALSQMSRQLWYDASSWFMAKQFVAHGAAAHFYVFSQAAKHRWTADGGEIAAHGHDTTWWNGGGQAGREGGEDGGGQPAGLGRAMLQYLAAFVRTGDPNTGGHGLPLWPGFSAGCEGYMELGPDFPAAGSADDRPGRLIQLCGTQDRPGPMWPGLKPEVRRLYTLMEQAYFARRIPELMAQTTESASI